jgi:cytochrome c
MRALILALLFSISIPALASTDLARAQNCLACHAQDRKLVGPSFDDIAKKYRGQGKEPYLIAKIRNGGGGVWGPVPMPANTRLTDAEAKQLIDWILK